MRVHLVLVAAGLFVVGALAGLAYAADWYVMPENGTEAEATACVNGRPKAQLVAIYNSDFTFAEARCYPNGEVN